VAARANLKDPLLVSEYLWGLCDPEQLNGEVRYDTRTRHTTRTTHTTRHTVVVTDRFVASQGGYYLTVFCSAFEYLKGLEMDTAESECQQREEEALKYLDDKVLQPSDHSPKGVCVRVCGRACVRVCVRSC
jgi:hypothetical protein